MKNETFFSDSERVVCTGGLGFIGSHLVDKLVNQGFEVYVFDNLSVGKLRNSNRKAEYINVDLCNYEELIDVMKEIKPKYVYHLAAFARIQPSLKEPTIWIPNNTTSTVNILWSCVEVGVEKVVFSSSSSIYGDNKTPFKETMSPDIKTPYALSKLFGEQMCKMFTKLYGLPCVTVRYFNVYGKRQIESGKFSTVIGVFMKQKKEGKKLTITDLGKNKRDFTFIDDIVNGTYHAMLYGRGGEVYNLGCGKNYSLKYLATLIQPDKKMHSYGLERKQEAWETKADISKSMRELGWTPKVSLKEGIKRCMA